MKDETTEKLAEAFRNYQSKKINENELAEILVNTFNDFKKQKLAERRKAQNEMKKNK